MDKKNEIMIIDELSIKDKIYTIRGEQVMLDFELAEIYGYSTKAFNQQVKNNKEKFEGYIFRLTKEELLNLAGSKKSTLNNNQSSWSKKLTLNVSGNKRGYNIKYLPYAFTESGIYMLMTVLRGPLAIEQSRKLISTFKGMKDYITTTNQLSSMNAVVELVNQVNENKQDIKDVKNQLTVVMDNFIDPSKYEEFLVLDGEKFKADVAYKTIFSLVKKSLIIVDNYVSYKTLDLLRGIDPNLEVTIYSDNMAKDKVTDIILNDFINETNINVSIKPTFNNFHDRYLILDNEKVYISGPSIKDAGNKIATIIYLDHKIIADAIISLFI